VNALRAGLAVAVVGAAGGAAAFGVGCGHSNSAAADAGTASRDFLLDPQNCGNCHINHYQDWLASAHANASDDPVFVAMNQRGQRETDGGLGAFCVKCHAPMAVLDQKTTDGLNLSTLDTKYHGVTCIFCHTAESVDTAHPYNANVTLSKDWATMRAELQNPAPVANPVHHSAYSTLQDKTSRDSAALCGTCHDILNPLGTHIERTFQEWHGSAYNADDDAGGETCAQCHMQPPAFRVLAPGGPPRPYAPHDFPAVDTPLVPDAAAQRAAVQKQFDDGAVRGALCVTPHGGIRVILDPFGVGHAWPSGSAQDRRVWAEVIAFKQGNVIFQSGVVPDGTPVGTEPEANPDDLWLFRDVMFDSQCNQVNMFWQAAKIGGNQLPAATTFNKSNPAFYGNHLLREFPKSGFLSSDGSLVPDRVTLRIRVQPIGLDVLGDLVRTNDLDAGIGSTMPTFDVPISGPGSKAMLEWTPEAASDAGLQSYPDPNDPNPGTTCVGYPGFIAGSSTPAPTPKCPQ